MENAKMSPTNPSEKTPGLRWWPAALILLVALGRLAFTWLGEAEQLQDRVVPTILTAGPTILALLLWWTFLSRIPWRTRGKGLLAVGLVFGLFMTLFKFESFSGDLLPIFSFRFAGDADLAEARGRAAAPTATSPTDYPQFLGQGRDATVSGVALARDWEAQPPKELWRRDVGESWSAFSIVGDAAVTQEQRGEQEAVARYVLTTGEPVWVTTTAEVRFESPIGGIGPRATPTIHGGRVYAYGTRGMLTCLDLADGSILWQRDTLADAKAALPEWQLAGSPLIVDTTVVVSVGGPGGKSLMAYDLLTGDPVWSAGDDSASYASPMLANLAGTLQLVMRNQNSITGHDPVNGTVLWSTPWPGGNPNVAQPLPLGDDRLLVSSGYGIGSKLYRITRDNTETFAVEELWESRRMKAKFTNLVYYEGNVYGLDDGVMVCLNPETGERCWKGGRYGHGQLIRVEDLLLLIAEDGDLVLLEPNAEELREVARLPEALDGKSWNNPALSGRYLLLRNAKTAVCYEMPLAK